MNITQKQRISVEKIGVLPVFKQFCLCPSFLALWCRLLSFSFLCCRVSTCLPSPIFRPPPSLILYCGFSTPAVMRKISYSALNSFLLRHCGPDLRQKTCEFKDLYFWRNCRKSNLLSNDTDLTIFEPLRLEIWATTRDNIWNAGSSCLIQSLFFDSLFGQN